MSSGRCAGRVLGSWRRVAAARPDLFQDGAFIRHAAYNTGTLCADLHRFAFLLGASDGEELFGETTP